MSMNRYDYVIVGYDFTPLRDALYTEEWAENEENIDKWESYQSKGNIQVFSDPCSGRHLYFGYILSVNDEYEDKVTKIRIADMERFKPYVDNKLKQVGWNIPREPIPYQVICFSEWR